MKKLIVFLFTAFIIYACSSGSSGENNSHSKSRNTVNASLDLRLGQISGGSSPVAVSATLQNGESLSIFFNEDQSIDALLVTPSKKTLLASFDQLGRPQTAQIENIILSYSNYRKDNNLENSLVDITVQDSSAARTARNLSFPNQNINSQFINSDIFISILLGTDLDNDSGIRSIVAAALGALKIIGCSSDESSNALKQILPPNFLNEICDSKLLNKLESLVDSAGYQNITLNFTRFAECENPKGYQQKTVCSLLIAEEIARQVPDDNSTTGGGSSTGDSNTGSTSASTTGGSNTGSASTTGGSNTGSASTGGSNTAGDSNTGGTNTGGTNTGGTSTGGTSTGGTSTGGTSTGGTSTGGTSTGGTSTGGTSTGGTSTGGTSTGGTSTGGTSTGGTNTGGTSTGGTNTGGNNTGGGGGAPSYRGLWSGTFTNTSGSGCEDFFATFFVEATGSDILCQVHQCTIDMAVSSFTAKNSKDYQFTRLTGTVDRFGRVSVTDSSSYPGQFTLFFPSSSSAAGQGSQLNSDGNGTITFYINSPNSCHGTFIVNRNG